MSRLNSKKLFELHLKNPGQWVKITKDFSSIVNKKLTDIDVKNKFLYINEKSIRKMYKIFDIKEKFSCKTPHDQKSKFKKEFVQVKDITFKAISQCLKIASEKKLTVKFKSKIFLIEDFILELYFSKR